MASSRSNKPAAETAADATDTKLAELLAAEAAKAEAAKAEAAKAEAAKAEAAKAEAAKAEAAKAEAAKVVTLRNNSTNPHQVGVKVVPPKGEVTVPRELADAPAIKRAIAFNQLVVIG